MSDLPFSKVSAASERMASTRSRVTKAKEIVDLLTEAGPQAPLVVGFLRGEPRQGKIGIGYAQAYSVDETAADESSLTVGAVDEALTRIAGERGAGSVGRRSKILDHIFCAATSEEQAFLRKMLTGEMRHGALDGVILDAVIRGSGIDAHVVRRAAMLSGDLGHVAGLAMVGDTDGLTAIGLELMQPVLPMLATTAQSVVEAMEGMGVVSVEWKLDGVRVQVHRRGDEVAVYTRNQNDVTDRLPDVVAAVLTLDVESVVLDGEAMSVDTDGRPSPFQETMSRFGADAPGDDVPVLPFFFDIMHKDGSDLLDLDLSSRQTHLDGAVPEPLRIPRLITDDVESAETFLEEARARRHEGVMVKDLGSVYEAGRRGSAWRKVKPVHTLDLVILAAEWGHGRRTGKLSNLHLGARDAETDGFVMLGKTFKGLTDAMLEWQTDHLLAIQERAEHGTVYVRPELVVEVAFDGVLPSPRYPGGMALRFARVRGHRPDKNSEDADTIQTVRDIFEGRL